MLDLNHLEKYRENNRIEAKKAIGGLPDSIWETYSAFANTLGGVILLGVEERSDKSLHAVDLPDPVYFIEEFWRIINRPEKVSLNILTERDVNIENVDGNHIVVIHVPRAERCDKPVYIDNDPVSGTYRRNGEGDYHCTYEEILAMQRDAARRSQDMKVLENMDTDVFDHNSIRAYRKRMEISRPGHVWEKLEDDDLLYKLGAVSRGRDGRQCPTAAGLLMFGHEYEIVREFPDYRLEYIEQTDDGSTAFRILSSSGDGCGNVYDFYFKVYDRIAQDISDGGDAPVLSALREALANCIINADYYGRQGLVIVRKKDLITFSNPGNFRVDIEKAKSDGVSDPRNTVLIKMFNLIDIGEGAGNGIPNIYRIWDSQGWEVPTITEDIESARITVSLSLTSGDRCGAGRDKSAKKSERRKMTDLQKETIIEYLTDHVSAGTDELCGLLGEKSTKVNKLLSLLIAEGIVITDSSGTYRLREK